MTQAGMSKSKKGSVTKVLVPVLFVAAVGGWLGRENVGEGERERVHWEIKLMS